MNNFAKSFLLLSLLAASQGQAFGADDDLLQDAKQSIVKGQSKAAIVQLKSLLQKQPDNGEARLLLGETYIKTGDGASAVKELERARDIKAPKERWVGPLAQAYLLINKPKQLLEQLQPDPQLPAAANAKLLSYRGMAQLGLADESSKAEDSFKAALQADPDSVEALMGLGMMEMSRRQLKPAEDYLGKATAKAPKNLQAWLLLAEIKRALNDLPGSLVAFTKALELSPTDLRGLLGRASVYIGMGKLDEARTDVNAARKSAPETPLTLYTQGLLDFQSNKLDEARESLLKLNGMAPDHLPTAYLLGSIAFQKGEVEQAEHFLSKVVASTENNIPAIKLLAATRIKRGKPVEAIKLLKPLAEKEKNDAQLFAMLGSAYLKNKEYDQGVAYLSRAAEIAPDVASVRAELGLGRIASGKMDQGVADLKSAVGIDPNLLEADATIILAMIQQKKFDEAIAEAGKLKAKRKNDPLADNLLGAAYLAKGDVEHARESWQNALVIKPDYSPANLNLAKIYMAQNQPAEAVKQYEAVLKRDDKNVAAFIGLAQVAETKKDYAEMVKRLEEARRKNPSDLTPVVMLTRYYLSQSKSEKALDVANEAVSKNPDNFTALQNLGMAQMGSNQTPSAVATYKQLIGKQPDNIELHHLLAQGLYKLGDKAGAIKEWDEALRLSPDFIPALLAKSELAMLDKRYGDVIRSADTIKAKYPASPLGFQLEGDVLMAQKQFDKSLFAYNKAYQIAPSSYLARRIYMVRHELHQDQEALEALRNWLGKSDTDADAWGLLASGLQDAGKLEEAKQAYEKAYALRPENLVLQNNLTWLYQELGDKRALSMAEKIASAPGIENKSEILDTVGWVLLLNGREDKGLVLLQQAALQEPRNTTIRFHLASAFEKTGKKEEARKELERLLKENKSFPERDKATEILKGL